MWRAAEDAGVVHATGFNYRFVPAVRLARELVRSGELGEIVHFRARYLQSWGWDALAADCLPIVLTRYHGGPAIAVLELVKTTEVALSPSSVNPL